MPKKEKKVEVVRSFSFKLNCGNYQTADFFCSQKAEVPEEEAEETSKQLHQFCKAEVMKSVNKYITEKREEQKKMKERKVPKWLEKVPYWYREEALKSTIEDSEQEESLQQNEVL